MEKVEKKAVSIEAEHISQISCAGCQKVLDVSHLNPFTKIKCPECGMEQIVPAKFGAFLLIKQLGAGGMGVIYRAMDRELGRQVALKVMKKSLGDNPEFYKAFKHEAQAAAALNHRNVVQIYSFGQYNGQPYIVMELVDGGKLEDLISGPAGLDELKALDIHLEVTEGLMAASDVGLVHGDVKPANILFGKNGEAKVVDFGLASYIGEQQQGGPVWGTPYYIAPEKARGKKVDFRSDIYSLGGTLFHVLTGKPPFDGPTSNDVVMARLNQPAPNIRDINPNIHLETAQMVARMLEMDPVMRYPSYPALLIDMRNAIKSAKKPLARLSHISNSIPIKKTETKVKSLFQKVNWKIAAGVAAGIILVALGVGGWLYNNKRQERLQQEAAARQLFEQSRAAGRATWDRIVNLSVLLVQTGTNIMPYAEKADNIAASINRVDDPNALLMDETDKVKEWINESDDIQANALILIQQLDASTNAQTAKRLSDDLETAFSRLITINTSMGETGEIIREAFKEANALQRKTMEEVNRIKAEKARVEASRRKVEDVQKQAKKKDEELKKVRPAIIQQELDVIERCRGANAIMIAQKRFEEAERSFATVQARITLDETRAACKNIMETYGEIAKLKSWLMNAINRAPCKNCWVMGASRSDIVKASGENGVTVALGGTGSTIIQWEAITVSQLLKMVNYYAESMGLSEPQKAIIFKQAALYCYESGVFKTAETYANAAYKANPDIQADLNRLMPDILSPE